MNLNYFIDTGMGQYNNNFQRESSSLSTEFYSAEDSKNANNDNSKKSAKQHSNGTASMGANGTSLTTTASLGGTDTEPDMQTLQELVY